MDRANPVIADELPLRRTLGFQLCCWFLAVGLIPLAIAGIGIFSSMRGQIEHIITGELIARASRHLSLISENLLMREEALISIAHSPETADVLNTLSTALNDQAPDSAAFHNLLAQKRMELRDSAETFHLANIYLVTPEGKVVFSLRSHEEIGVDLFQPPYADTELGKVVVRTLTLLGIENSEYEYYPPTNEPAIFMAAPVYVNKLIQGVAVVMLEQHQIEHIVHDGTVLGQTGETVIFAPRKDKAMIVAPTRFDENAAFRHEVPYDSAGGKTIEELLSGHQGSGITTDYRGQRVLAHWKYFPAFRWGVMVKMDTQEAFRAVRTMGIFTMIICGLTALAVLLIAFAVAKGVTAPVTLLADFTKVIAGGDFSKQIPVTATNEIGLLANSVNEMVLGLKERETVKTAFARYVSHQILDTVIESGQVPEVKGERRKITALFSDIRGFTSLSEKLTSEEVVGILNEYFEQMVRIVFRNKGTIDKFIGDGLMVVFGAPVEDADQEIHAVQSAIEMQHEIAKLRERWLGLKNIEIKVGIGINTGFAIVGNIGSSERLEYTAIGDTVNLASRLESATKELHVDILVSEPTNMAVASKFRTVSKGEVVIRGKAAPVAVFEVTHDDSAS